MKQLQNNFTTPEQSKRLLELGVPADSADCIFYKFSSSDKTWGRQQVLIADEKFSNICIPDQEYLLYLPCWSVGRLIEIAFICSVYEVHTIDFFRNDPTIYDIIFELVNSKMDFSKLEE